MTRLSRARHAFLAFAAIVLFASTSVAAPVAGALRPMVRLVDAWDRALDVPTVTSKAILVVYEDKESSAQNEAFRADLTVLSKADGYAANVVLLPIADVQGYDYWPARGFVKDAVRTQSNKIGTLIYCDWNGAVRGALGLRRGVSNVVLYGKDGRALFAYEGSMPVGKRRELIELLRNQLGG